MLYTLALAAFCSLFGILKEVTNGWPISTRILFIAAMLIGVGLMGSGIMASTSTIMSSFTGYSPVASRISFIIGCCLFEIAISRFAGTYGYIMGTGAALVTLYAMGCIWKVSDPASANNLISWVKSRSISCFDNVKNFCLHRSAQVLPY